MHTAQLLVAFAGTIAALPSPSSVTASSKSNVAAFSSSSASPKSTSPQYGADAKQLSQSGWWHWLPGNGIIPGWSGQGKCVQIQHKFSPLENRRGSENYKRAEAVKQYYVDAWNQYADHAFGNDSFNPLANTGGMGGGGWGLIIIDGIDTAITMGLKDIVDRQLAWIAQVDFTTSSDPRIDGFDTTIRVIGGLLSAFDLITSGLVPHASSYNKDHVKALLKGAKDLADLISPLFSSPTGIPYFWMDIPTKNVYGGVNTAVAGTIILEYYRLSDLTGDDKYRKMADKAESYLVNPKPETVFPNLVGSVVSSDTGEFATKDAGWNSGIDSFYEYLIKTHIYNPKDKLAASYKDFWVTAVDSTIKHLAVHPYGNDQVTWITQLTNDGAPRYEMDDYSCFAGGNFLLGGAYLGRKDFMQLGLDFTDSCYLLYNTTASGLNPLAVAWYGPNNTASNPAYNGDSATAMQARANYNKTGSSYFVNFESGFSSLYTLYPEPIESNMYAYRITGQKKWQDHNWAIFEAIKRDCQRGSVVVSDLFDVTAPDGGGQFPDVPSYFFAETLKYLYLTFSDPKLVSLDDFQFNTECHPVRVQGGTCSTSGRPSLPGWLGDLF